MIQHLAKIKKAADIYNSEAQRLPEEKAAAIIYACDEIIAGKLKDQFIVDGIQGGAGTSANMNANEVIANRAIESLGGTKGDYTIVHPNDHVNMAQSTNCLLYTSPADNHFPLRRLSAPRTRRELPHGADHRRSGK